MFADLCRLSSFEMWRFAFVCLFVGALCAGGIHRWLAQRSLAEISPSGCLLQFGAALTLGLMAAWGTDVLFPNPNNIDQAGCGFTPDSIFLPIIAGVVTPFSFLLSFFIVSAVSSARNDEV